MAEIILAFEDRFAPLVMDGRKAQTVRQAKPGKPVPVPGDTVWAVGASAQASIGKWPVTSVLEMQIDLKRGAVRLAGQYELDEQGREVLAHQDGFTCWADMLQWFRQQYAGLALFEGYLIEWDHVEAVAA